MPSDPHPHIHTEIEPLGDTGRLAQVTVDNPTRLNVLDSDLIRQLRAAIRALEPDRQLRCVVLRGAGDRAFIGDSTFFALALAHDAEVVFDHLEPVEVDNVFAHGWWSPEALEADGTAVLPDLPDIMTKAVAAIHDRSTQ